MIEKSLNTLKAHVRPVMLRPHPERSTVLFRAKSKDRPKHLNAGVETLRGAKGAPLRVTITQEMGQYGD